MKLKLFIPRGSKLYDGEEFIATTLINFEPEYRPIPDDFSPPLPEGRVIDYMRFFYNDELIYLHPYFIRT